MNRPIVVGSALALAFAAFLLGRYTRPSHSADASAARRISYYVDPMHPAYRSDRPGIAPDCGMALVAVYEGDDLNSKLQLSPGAVAIDAARQQLAGVKVETVGRSSGARLIHTTGHVEADEGTIHRVMAGTEGWVQSVENNPPGTLVKQNELLATVYSKDFRNAQQAYISSITSMDRLKVGHDAGTDLSHMSDSSVRVNEEQLRALGMGEPQIKELAKKKQTTRDVIITSPINGIVLSRSVAPGERFENGTEFYRIADLSKVWIVADLYGEESRWLAPGTRVNVTVRELSKRLYARVGPTPALFDPVTRTLKLRLEAENPGLVLRPDMFVDLEFNAKTPPGISIPQEAVLDSGLQKIVYLETSDGVFEPRPIETTSAYGDRIVVAKGLKPGDRVVVAGNFLIDSESRLHSAPASSATASAGAAPAARPEVAATRDPVCGMKLDANKAQSGGHTERYHGGLFVFCSDNCQKKFHQDPARYVDVKVGNAAEPSSGLRRFDD